MKTTLEIPDEVVRQSKAAAALRGESLKDFVSDALRVRLETQGVGKPATVGRFLKMRSGSLPLLANMARRW